MNYNYIHKGESGGVMLFIFSIFLSTVKSGPKVAVLVSKMVRIVLVRVIFGPSCHLFSIFYSILILLTLVDNLILGCITEAEFFDISTPR